VAGALWRCVLLAVPLLHAACAPGMAVYDRPGASYAEWVRDDSECRRVSGEGTGAGIDRDAHGRCMRAKGYRLRGE
jgi:hypothetical protein